ncbi:MAG: pyridoxamine 5'-phosphate oxidase family protein [Desulfobacteraceae bacterium]|nr:pyridoxamine 5'-phosphate oxidase family protein [Desulfobacteraceae bacterium]
MELKDYFEKTTGTGVLSTADGNGLVNAAIYSRPHFIEGDKLAFIMRDRLSHKNLESNPHAVYLFIADGPGYKGKRLYLRMVREEKNTDQIEILQRRKITKETNEDRFLVFFELVRERPLVGDKNSQ